MLRNHSKMLIDTIRRLLRRDATGPLRRIVNKTHAADLSILFHSLSLNDQKCLFNMIEDKETQGDLFSELDEDTFLDITDDMSVEDLISILEFIPNDDVADLIGRLPNEKADLVLEGMKKENSQEVEYLLKYDDKTAGGIMVPDFVALKEDTTAKQAVSSLQKEYLDVEMPFYLYVVDEYGHLVGVSSLRQLVVISPETPLKNFMSTEVMSVHTAMDQEEVAKIVSKYNILAVPVIDDNNKLVGIITVDDVIDIIREEATEDILKMAGVGEEYVETKSILRSTKIRLPWLFASCLGGIFAFFIINYFEETLNKIVYLAAFIPVIMGMGGNVGTQSSTIVVRGLATGRLNIRHLRSVVFKELAVGMILGFFYGLFLGIIAQIYYNVLMLGVVVGLAVASSMAVATLVGSLVPMVFARINVDPAVATGPFVTTAIDIVSVFCYFKIATNLLTF
ncbi:Magnesium transporter MgtE [Candidatus Magnetomoraceae bacterium gMMP-15]